MQFEKGDWIVSACWYVFCPSKTNRQCDRFYKKGLSQWIPCNSIVRSIKPREVIMRWSGNHYRMSKDIDEKIMEFGDLLNND